jgi:hypothetical protein
MWALVGFCLCLKGWVGICVDGRGWLQGCCCASLSLWLTACFPPPFPSRSNCTPNASPTPSPVSTPCPPTPCPTPTPHLLCLYCRLLLYSGHGCAGSPPVLRRTLVVLSSGHHAAPAHPQRLLRPGHHRGAVRERHCLRAGPVLRGGRGGPVPSGAVRPRPRGVGPTVCRPVHPGVLLLRGVGAVRPPALRLRGRLLPRGACPCGWVWSCGLWVV